jgi:catechol 2,3-dioxygenase-like lactoylglutathione lyase family enzyme
MAIQRMDNVLIVVEDLEAAKAFFAELGMELEGETQVEGPWVGQVVGLDDVRADIAMMRTPDGHGRVELTRFHTPLAVEPRQVVRLVEASDGRLVAEGSVWAAMVVGP